jgi:hypothetical protein
MRGLASRTVESLIQTTSGCRTHRNPGRTTSMSDVSSYRVVELDEASAELEDDGGEVGRAGAREVAASAIEHARRPPRLRPSPAAARRPAGGLLVLDAATHGPTSRPANAAVTVRLAGERDMRRHASPAGSS